MKTVASTFTMSKHHKAGIHTLLSYQLWEAWEAERTTFTIYIYIFSVKITFAKARFSDSLEKKKLN